MNRERLERVIQHYIDHFDEINGKDEHGEPYESYKWEAVRNFQNALDLDVPREEFAAKLYQAMRATENLIDSGQQQPFYALCKYAKEEAEPETVRTMLKDLFADDGGDLERRQEKIDVFLNRAEELRKKYAPNSRLSVNNQRSAMAYLWFYDPDRYYYYKATESQFLAEFVEFYDDWGTYDNFKLDVYHRFCDEVVAYMKQHDALKKVQEKRYKDYEKVKGSMHPDTELHILLVDLAFCAKRYGLLVSHVPAAVRRQHQENKAKAEELLAAAAEAERDGALLDEAWRTFRAMLTSGAAITHKTFGTAEFVELDETYCTLSFGTKGQKKMDLALMLTGGFLRVDHPDFAAAVERYRYVLKNKNGIANRLKLAQTALEPYKEYLD